MALLEERQNPIDPSRTLKRLVSLGALRSGALTSRNRWAASDSEERLATRLLRSMLTSEFKRASRSRMNSPVHAEDSISLQDWPYNPISNDCLQRLLALAPHFNSEKPRRGNEAFVITGKLHYLLLGTDKLKRRKVNGI